MFCKYMAGSMFGIEREVWSAIYTPGFGGPPLSLTAEEVRRFRAISAKATLIKAPI
jgi:hypothetical protein